MPMLRLSANSNRLAAEFRVVKAFYTCIKAVAVAVQNNPFHKALPQ
jgi:hypothetical protein